MQRRAWVDVAIRPWSARQSLHVRSTSVRGDALVDAGRSRPGAATLRKTSRAQIQQKTNTADIAHQTSAAFNRKYHMEVSLTLPATSIRHRGSLSSRDRDHGSVRAPRAVVHR